MLFRRHINHVAFIVAFSLYVKLLSALVPTVKEISYSASQSEKKKYDKWPKKLQRYSSWRRSRPKTFWAVTKPRTKSYTTHFNTYFIKMLSVTQSLSPTSQANKQWQSAFLSCGSISHQYNVDMMTNCPKIKSVY